MQVYFKPSPYSWIGANELAACIAASCSDGHPNAHPALGLSGAAFRTYFFNPDDNYNYRVEHPDHLFRWDSFDVENFGVAESLAAHFERDIRLHAHPSGAELLKLLQSESDGDRTLWASIPVFSRSLLQCSTMALSNEAESFVLELSKHDLTRRLPQVAWLLTVRPPRERTPVERKRVLKREVLRFAVMHARSGRELSHQHDLY